MEKKYWNKGAFMTDLNRMIVADERHLDRIEDPALREAIGRQLEVHLPVHPDKVLLKIECVGVCGSDVHYFHEGQCGTFFLDKARNSLAWAKTCMTTTPRLARCLRNPTKC